MIIPRIAISQGVEIPSVGLGLWQNTHKQECISSIQAAFEAGYRHLDTAQAYGNESHVGDALKRSGRARDDVFITTKIAVQNFDYQRLMHSFEQSLQNLQTDYVDLALLHFPVPLLRGRAWRALEALYGSGKARAVGVSNYTVRHLKGLLKDCAVRPAVNQVELHVYLQQPELIRYCQDQGIIVEAYSPLAHGYGLDSPVLRDIAQKYSKTPTHIMLRWCIEQGTIPLPKSVQPDRIRQNIDLFDFSLDRHDMTRLATLNQNKHTCWNPTYTP